MASISKLMKTNIAAETLDVDLVNETLETVVDIPVGSIDEMPGNRELFPYDEQLLAQLEAEIKMNGFRDPIKVIKKPDGRYTCVSGNQRLLVVRDRLKQDRIKSLILKDMTERQINDLWRSENIIHRKITPLTNAKLIQSFIDDYEKYDLSGGKRKYASLKTGIPESSIARFLNILKFPEYIQNLCSDVDFPYNSLMAAADFPDKEKDVLCKALKKRETEHPSLELTAGDLKKIIAAVDKDFKDSEKYDDVNLDEKYESASKEKSREATDFVDKNFRMYRQKVEEDIERESSGIEKPQIIDEDLGGYAKKIYAMSKSKILIGNRMLTENNLKLLENAIAEIRKKMDIK